MNNNVKNTILLIDSDTSVMNNLADRLSSVGFNVLTADDEDVAEKFLMVGSPDIIMLDILMRGKNEHDMLTIIKSNIISANIPLIILTSDTDVNSKVYGFLSGASDYIIKPFRFPEVLARVNNQLRILNMQKELEEKNKELLEKNELLQQMAMTDALTGLYNRGYIMGRLGGELSHAARYKEPITFIMIDVDHFKQTNDTYGHLTGDELLKDVAKQIKASVRDADITARYGGEEFLVVCPNTDLPGAKVLAERIRESIENVEFLLEGNIMHVTVSLGIRCSTPKSPLKAEAELNKLIGEADIALYVAKANGRNRVEAFSSSMSSMESRKAPRNTRTSDKIAH